MFRAVADIPSTHHRCSLCSLGLHPQTPISQHPCLGRSESHRLARQLSHHRRDFDVAARTLSWRRVRALELCKSGISHSFWGGHWRIIHMERVEVGRVSCSTSTSLQDLFILLSIRRHILPCVCVSWCRLLPTVILSGSSSSEPTALGCVSSPLHLAHLNFCCSYWSLHSVQWQVSPCLPCWVNDHDTGNGPNDQPRH